MRFTSIEILTQNQKNQDFELWNKELLIAENRYESLKNGGNRRRQILVNEQFSFSWKKKAPD